MQFLLRFSWWIHWQYLIGRWNPILHKKSINIRGRWFILCIAILLRIFNFINFRFTSMYSFPNNFQRAIRFIFINKVYVVFSQWISPGMIIHSSVREIDLIVDNSRQIEINLLLYVFNNTIQYKYMYIVQEHIIRVVCYMHIHHLAVKEYQFKVILLRIASG